MLNHPIFPRLTLALALAMAGIWAQGAWAADAPVAPAQGSDSDATAQAVAALEARKPPHEQAIRRIDAQRLAFQRDLADREEQCLKRFFSSGCMDDIRTEHLREMRRFDLEREVQLQALRDIDAEIRKINRAQRMADKAKRQAS